MADDTKPNAAGLALLNAQMDSLAREIGEERSMRLCNSWR